MPNAKDRIDKLAEHAIEDIDTVLKALKANKELKKLELDLEHAKKDCADIKGDNHAPQ